MGQCFSVAKELIQTSPPLRVKTISKERYSEILTKKFPKAYLETSDGNYLIYSKEDLQRFLAFDFTNFKTSEKEKFDCDDFAKVLLGRERSWVKQRKDITAGSTFGIIHGDIRTSEEDTTPRYHAVNYVVLINDEYSSTDAKKEIIDVTNETNPTDITNLADGIATIDSTNTTEPEELWLIEPQNDQIFKITSNSRIWFAFS